MNADYNSETIEDFRLTIDALKNIAKQQGHEVTNTDIAMQLNISTAQLEKYYSSNDVPHALYTLLREKYSNFLSSLKINRIWFTVEVEDDDEPYVPPPGKEEHEEEI